MKRKSLLFLLLFALIAPWAANAQTSLFSEDFESGSMPTGWTQDGNGTWSVGTGDYHTSTGAGHGSYNAKITHGTSGNATKLITPEIDLSTVTTANLSFMYVMRDWYGDTDELRVYYRAAASDTWTQLLEYTDDVTSWTDVLNVTLPNLSSTYQLAFEFTDNYGYGVGVDYVRVEEPASCLKPTNLSLTTDGENVTATWEGTAANYNIDVDGNVTNGVTSPYTFRVELSTTYTVKVQADCGGGDLSSWTDPVSITTPPCLGGHMINYSLTDSYGDGWNGNAIIVIDENCEEIANLTIESGSSNSGTLTLCGEYYEFVWKKGSYPGEASWSFTEGGIVLFEGTGTSSMATGDVLYTIGNYAYPRPTNLDAEVAKRSASLSWDENGTAEAWEICFNGDDANLITVTATDLEEGAYLMANLTPETEYTFKVRATGTEGTSAWSCLYTFSTLPRCVAPTNLAVSDITKNSAHITWSGDETTHDLRYAVVPGGRKNAAHLHFSDINTTAPEIDLSTLQIGAANAQTNDNTGAEQLRDGWVYYDNGSYSGGIGTGGSTVYWAVMFPAGTYTGNLLTRVAVYEASDQNTNPITVYVCAGGDTAPTEILYTETFETEAADAFHEVVLAEPVDVDPSQNLWIVMSEYGSYPAQGCADTGDPNGRWISLDGENWVDVTTYNLNYTWMIRAYLKEFDLNTLSWTEAYGLSEFSYDMTGLDPETFYIVQIRANCDEEGTSEWVNAYFTTLPTCLMPTGLTVGEVTAHTAAISWTANGEATNWQICLDNDEANLIDVTETSYTFTGLAEQTTFNVKVRSNCGDGDFSDWTENVSFTTDIACYAPTSLAVANITPTSALVSWASGANSCDLRYAVMPAAGGESWMLYDNGTYATNIGSSSANTRTWAVMYPASMLDGNTELSMVSIYENSYIQSNITIKIYQGGDNAPETLLHTETITPINNGFHEVALSEVVTLDPTQNLWIALTATGPYVIPSCESTEYNNQWLYSIANGWYHFVDLDPETTLNAFGWMIRAYVGNMGWIDANDLAEYSYPLSELDPETPYVVQVRSNCEEEGYSVWTSTYFTTPSTCQAPWNLTVSNITATTAGVNWEGYMNSYDVRYYYIESSTTTSTENFESGEIPTSITNDATYPWTVVEGNEGKCIKSGNAGTSSSTSAISMTVTYASDGTIEFDAECMGEGSSTYFDHCDFFIDGSRVFYHGADLGSGWNHYSFEVTAGAHVFRWAYTKDSTVNPTGDYFAVDNIVTKEYNFVYDPVIEEVTPPYTITGLTPATRYYVQVKGHGCEDTQWSASANFTTPAYFQTLNLTEGWNWISLSIEVEDPIATLQALEEALGENGLHIESDGMGTEYLGDGLWLGDLEYEGLTNEQMFLIEVGADCTVELQGIPVNPANHEITIYPGWNWIGFPCAQEMTIAEAFAEFEAEFEDLIESKDEEAAYFGEWMGFETLQPGQGYMYFSNSTETKTLIIQTGAKARLTLPALGNNPSKQK